MLTNKLKLSAYTAASLTWLLASIFLVKAHAATYTVQAGDTLSQIAYVQETSLEKLIAINQLDNPNLLQVGQVLELDDVTITLEEESRQDTELTSSSLSQADLEAKEIIAQRESGGSYTAQNGIYYGRYQLTLSYLNGDLSPENQERVADAYVANRYGSWSMALIFWNNNGWY